jgi:hypothetical protein
MVTIDFNGYGAEYAIGKLKPIEVENLKFLLERFDHDAIMEKYEIGWGDGREQFYEFDDVYQAWSLCDNFTATIRESEADGTWEDIDFCESKAEYKTINYKGSDGFFICSCSSEKGYFFTITLDIEPEEFDPSLLTFHYDDLSLTWLSDNVLMGISYNGENVELDYDGADTVGKGFYQRLIYIEDGNELDGMELLTDEIDPPKYTTFDDIIEDEADVVADYVELCRSKTLKPLSTPIVWHSPMLYDRFPEEDVDEFWYDKNQIKKAFEFDMVGEIPKHILEKMEEENPEWLI